jgi:hypothetical protein
VKRRIARHPPLPRLRIDSTTMTHRRSIACAVVGALAVSAAAAHDTWFAPLPAARGGAPSMLALGTGNQFPTFETAIDVDFLVASGCRGADGAPVPMRKLRYEPRWTVLRVGAPAARGAAARNAGAAQTCWAQLRPLDIEIGDDKVQVYFKEISPPAAVRERWDALRARGVAWKERYVKSARVELGGAAPAAPVGMDMDALIDGLTPLRVGEERAFKVLREGRPLAGFAVEFRSDVSPVGIWRRTDDDGRVRFAPPLPGRWVLRGTELRVSQTIPDGWDSSFITLTFDVGATAR